MSLDGAGRSGIDHAARLEFFAMSLRRTIRILARPAAAGLSLSLAAFLAACVSADGEATKSAAVAAPGAVDTPAQAFAFRGGASVSGWFPIREGVGIEGDAKAGEAVVRYERTRGTASGLAIQLAPGSCATLESLAIRGSSQPAQRLHLCLTDANGVVWTFPTVKLGAAVETHRVSSAEIVPDPFQNAGKTIPAAPDWSAMRMLTVIDISGHMGAPVEQVTWRIESIVGEEVQR